MREIRSYGSVGVPAGNRRHYPEERCHANLIPYQRSTTVNHEPLQIRYSQWVVDLLYFMFVIHRIAFVQGLGRGCKFA